MAKFKIPQILLLCVMVLAALANAEVPQLINYQGRLTDDGGEPANGSKFMKFKIYGSVSGDDSLWSSGLQAVTITDGLFNYELGSNVVLPADLFTGNDPRYLGITVDTDAEIVPRVQFITVPYAFHASVADSTASDGDWIIDGGDVYRPTGYVGIGNTNPREDLVVGNDIGNYSGNRVVIADDEAGVSTGLVIGKNNDSRSWILWDVDYSHLSIGTKEEGTNFGNIMNFREGHVGIGVIPDYYYAFQIYSGSPASKGIHVFQYAPAGSGDITAGEFIASHPSENYATGIYASCDHSDENYGVYSYGNLHSTGSNTKAGGGYKIDHPQDPENMYLTHSDVSSPEQKNVYDGTVVTDMNCNAVVALPSYFESLNGDFRYQLTVVGDFAQAIISEEIKDNQFTIKTDKPSVKVCWQVTGIRKDAFAKSRSTEIEVFKDTDERGLYQNPEIYGYGIENSINKKHHEVSEESK